MDTLCTNSWGMILVIAFSVLVFIQLMYYIRFLKISFFKKKKKKVLENPGVSIIIAAKNNEFELERTLPLLLQQVYPQFEVVVIDIDSSDQTQYLLLGLSNQHSNLKVINLNSSVSNIKGKKFPLSLGIKSASYDYVMITEPHCAPNSTLWLQKMAPHFCSKKIVLGYTTYEKKGTFGSALRRYDLVHNAIQYFSFATAKKPYMGIGTNLGYSKALFFKSNGFIPHSNIPYGGDDLFVNAASTSKNTAVEFHPHAHITSSPTSESKDWFDNKIHRNKTRRFYKFSQRLSLGLYHISLPLLYLTFGLALFSTLNNSLLLIILLSFMLLKQIAQYVIIGSAAKKLNEKALIPFILFFDIILALINPIVCLTSWFRKK